MTTTTRTTKGETMTAGELKNTCNELLINSGYEGFGRFWTEYDGRNSAGHDVVCLGFSDNRDARHYVKQMDWIRVLLRRCGMKTRKHSVSNTSYYWLKVTA